VNPVDAMGVVVSDEVYRREMGDVFSGGVVRLVGRGPRDPLPVE